MIVEHGTISELPESKEGIITEESSRNDSGVQNSNFRKLEGFDDPIEFLAFFDDAVNTGRITLYPWQVEIGEQLGKVKPTGLHPHKFCLCAANGSGKDAYIVTPFALWFICTKIKALVIITSSSGVQLTNQTEKYIKNLAEQVNAKCMAIFGEPILKINQRKITCTLSGSEILLFATDEEGKAEGYHPIDGDSEMAIVVNEAKSVKPEIFRALKRCTGYNYWLNVSTPGEPIGDFYNSWENWHNKKRVTFYDCLRHQSQDEFEEEKRLLGEHDPLFRSKWLALFTFVGGNAVINQIAFERMIKRQADIKHIFQHLTLVGLDIALSTNGDESVATICKGNKETHKFTYRVKDAEILAGNVDKDLRSIGITFEQQINADEGGVGRPFLDIMRRKGWKNINRVLNQSPAKNKKRYRNRGAELWDKFNLLVTHHCLILKDDDKTRSQIVSRKYKTSEAGVDKLTLQSKREMMSEGIHSPDRADSLVLCFAHINVQSFIDGVQMIVESDGKPMLNEQEQLAELNRQLGMGTNNREKGGKLKGYSLNALMSRNRKRNMGRFTLA